MRLAFCFDTSVIHYRMDMDDPYAEAEDAAQCGFWTSAKVATKCPSGSAGEMTWACSACVRSPRTIFQVWLQYREIIDLVSQTFDNDGLSSQCTICGTPRPPTTEAKQAKRRPAASSSQQPRKRLKPTQLDQSSSTDDSSSDEEAEARKRHSLLR